MTPTGLVTMPKELAQHELLNREAANRKSALLDLWFLANDADRFATINGRHVPVKRGQLARAISGLAELWNWGAEKTKKVLLEFQEEGLIRVESSSTTTIITVIDYPLFNADTNAKRIAEPSAEPITDHSANPSAEPSAEPIRNRKGKGNMEGEVPPINKQNPEIEVPSLEEFVAACGMRGIPEWRAQLEHAWRSERPADRWPTANWQTAVTALFNRWRILEGAPANPSAKRQENSRQKNGGAGRERGEILQLLAEAKKSGEATEDLERELAQV